MLVLFGFLKKLNAENLFRNSAFLLGNLFLTTGCGFGALTLLTHLFSVQDVGLSATAISGCSLIQNITQFGVSDSLPRFLPTARNRSALINTVLTAVLLSTLLAAGIFLALPYARRFFALGGWAFGPLFVVAACVLAAELVLGTVLVADRATDKMVAASVAPNLLGLAAPAALVFVGGLGSFIARVASDIASCIFYSRLIIKRGHKFRPQLNFSGMREILHFSFGMHMANLIGGLPALVLPLLVLSRVGAKEAAYWGIAMSIATFLFSLPGLVIRALLPEVSYRPAERRHLFRRSALLVPAIAVPALALAFFLSPVVLVIFGRTYATGAVGPLRWLIVAALVSMPLSVLGAILVVAKKSLMITIANAVDAIVVLGLAELWAGNVNQIAISWTFGEVGNIVLFGAFAVAALREVNWHWEDLGGTPAQSAADSLPFALSATGQLQGLDRLLAIAQQQRAAEVAEYDMWLRHQHRTTESQNLFAVTALRAAELRRMQATRHPRPAPEGSRRAPDGGPPAHSQAPPATGSDASHQQAFDVLFRMAARQRASRSRDPSYPYPSAPEQDHQDRE
jgi:O-antigen/teichoic acid export membrane protein